MNSCLLSDLFSGNPPFEKLTSSTRKKLKLYSGDLESFLLNQQGDTPVGIPYNRLAKIAAVYQTEHTRRAVATQLKKQGLSEYAAKTVADAAGKQGITWMENNPFIVAEYLGWADVCSLRNTLNINTSDPRFLIAAVNVAIRYLEENGNGDTLHTQDDILALLSSILKSPNLAQTALECAWKHQNLAWHTAKGGGFQSPAQAIMEETIATWVKSRIQENDAYQVQNTQTQDDAVRVMLNTTLSLVYGSAGTGKTTLLGKLARSAHFQHRRVFLLALAAKAARRIEEETGQESLTIEKFLLMAPRLRLKSSDLIVIDEASMLCVADFYRLVRKAGQSSFALVGDPIQLPPIQPGRPFIDLLKHKAIPRAHLQQTFRQEGGSPILDFALAVRAGDIGTALTAIKQGLPHIKHIHANAKSIREQVQIFHSQHNHNAQILSSLKDGPSGIHAINQVIASNISLPLFSNIEGLPVGAPVVVTHNIPDLSLDNGTIGTIINTDTIIFPNGSIQVSPLILDAIMPAYALTIHKSQGSQWDHVCIVIGQSRLLDRSLLYTAATRAIKTLTLIGEQTDIINAIQTPPRVFGIRTTLFDRIGDVL